jgi:hypothetical protein
MLLMLTILLLAAAALGVVKVAVVELVGLELEQVRL